MERTRRRRYLFNNNSVGFTAQISSPRHDQIPVQGAAGVPVGGGVSSARVENVRFGEIASVDEIEVFAEGVIETPRWRHQAERTAFSSTTTAIRGFNLLHTVRADRIVARLALEHPLSGEQPDIALHGSVFEGLVIGGRPVTVVYNECLFETPNLSGLDKLSDDAKKTPSGQPPTKPNARQLLSWSRNVQEGLVYDEAAAAKHGNGPKSGAEIGYRGLKSKDIFKGKPLLTSIVKRVEGLPGGAKANPYRPNEIYIPGFGKVFLGELLITPESRRLTMLRFELGCPCDGCGSCGESCTGGSWHP